MRTAPDRLSPGWLAGRGQTPPGSRRRRAGAAGGPRQATQDPILARTGKATITTIASAGAMLGFIGEAFLAFLKLLRGQARFRRVDLALLIQECGAQALPIVTLISFTVVVVTHKLASIFTIGNNSVFLDSETKTMIAHGDPKVLRDTCPDPKVRESLTRGEAEVGTH